METVVGIFQLRTDAERARMQLHLMGIENDKIATLSPGTSVPQVEGVVRISDSEGPGMGGALGGTVGAAVGAASGASIALATTSLFVPGVGPVLVAGLLGAVVLGATGALAGAFAGSALEHELAEGLPHNDLYVYEDALRKGHTVLIVAAKDSASAELVRNTLLQAKAESVDAAREDWWLGLKDAEQVKYEGDFEQDHELYRRGFQKALHPGLRGKSFEEAAGAGAAHPSSEKAYRSGYESGLSHQRQLEEQHRA